MLNRNSRVRYLGTIIIISLVLASCSLSPDIVESPLSPKEQYSGILAKWKGIKTLQGHFRVTAQLRGKKGSLRALLILSHPDKFRIEFITPGGTTEAILVSDSSSVSLYYPSERTLFSGKANNDNLNKILGMDLQPDEIIPVLMGKGYKHSGEPLSLELNDETLKADYETESGEYTVSIYAKTDKDYITGASLFVNSQDNEEFVKVSYSKFLHGAGYSYPRRIEIDFPTKNVTYSIKILNASYTTETPEPAHFRLDRNIKIDKFYQLERIKVDGTILFGKEE